MAERGNDHLDRAYNLAVQIQSILREIALSEAELRLDMSFEGRTDEFVESSTVFSVDEGALGKLVEALDRELKAAEFQPEAPVAQIGRWAALRIGHVKVTLPLRPIHRGYLKPTKILPIAMPVPERVAAFLINIPGGDHLLHRDNHGLLWHYHYINAEE